MIFSLRSLTESQASSLLLSDMLLQLFICCRKQCHIDFEFTYFLFKVFYFQVVYILLMAVCTLGEFALVDTNKGSINSWVATYTILIFTGRIFWTYFTDMFFYTLFTVFTKSLLIVLANRHTCFSFSCLLGLKTTLCANFYCSPFRARVTSPKSK